MQYKVTKVYLVDAADRGEARRRVVAEGAAHLKIISIQEVKTPSTADGMTARPAGPPAFISRERNLLG